MVLRTSDTNKQNQLGRTPTKRLSTVSDQHTPSRWENNSKHYHHSGGRGQQRPLNAHPSLSQSIGMRHFRGHRSMVDPASNMKTRESGGSRPSNVAQSSSRASFLSNSSPLPHFPTQRTPARSLLFRTISRTTPSPSILRRLRGNEVLSTSSTEDFRTSVRRLRRYFRGTPHLSASGRTDGDLSARSIMRQSLIPGCSTQSDSTYSVGRELGTILEETHGNDNRLSWVGTNADTINDQLPQRGVTHRFASPEEALAGFPSSLPSITPVNTAYFPSLSQTNAPKNSDSQFRSSKTSQTLFPGADSHNSSIKPWRSASGLFGPRATTVPNNAFFTRENSEPRPPLFLNSSSDEEELVELSDITPSGILLADGRGTQFMVDDELSFVGAQGAGFLDHWKQTYKPSSYIPGPINLLLNHSNELTDASFRRLSILGNGPTGVCLAICCTNSNDSVYVALKNLNPSQQSELSIHLAVNSHPNVVHLLAYYQASGPPPPLAPLPDSEDPIPEDPCCWISLREHSASLAQLSSQRSMTYADVNLHQSPSFKLQAGKSTPRRHDVFSRNVTPIYIHNSDMSQNHTPSLSSERVRFRRDAGVMTPIGLSPWRNSSDDSPICFASLLGQAGVSGPATMFTPRLVLVMEHCYLSLADAAHVQCHFRFNTSQIMRIARDTLRSLSYIHSMQLVHGDVKPQNLMLGKDGRIKIGDFGSALHVDESAKNEVENRSSSQFMGTLDYAAPEVLQGCSPRPASDLWSLGVTLAELWTGAGPAFYRVSETETVEAILYGEPMLQRCEQAVSPWVSLTRQRRDERSQLSFSRQTQLGTSWNRQRLLSPVPSLIEQSSVSPTFTLKQSDNGTRVENICDPAADVLLSIIRSLLAKHPSDRPTAYSLLMLPCFVNVADD